MSMDFRPLIIASLLLGFVVGIVATLLAGVVIDHVSVAVR